MYDLVIYPFHDWKKCQTRGLRRRDTQIILALEKLPDVGKILIVDRPVPTPLILYHLLKGERWFTTGGEPVRRTLTTHLRRLSSSLYVLDTIRLEPLSILLLRRAWWPYVLNHPFLFGRVREATEMLSMDRPLLWMFTPIAAPVIGEIDERLVVFDALDDWLTHEGMAAYREGASRGYEMIKQKADIAFCGSEQMQRRLCGRKPRSYWVPNAVDTDMFHPMKINISESPDDIQHIPAPRVGYIGVIDSRLDIDLLEHCARSLENTSFVLVGWSGKASANVNSLKALPNVYFLDPKPYEAMPAYINAFAACLLPHKVNPYTDGMSPLKLYEYLACGKPVVSTPVAGTHSFRNVIRIEETKEGFVEGISQSLRNDSSQLVQSRRSSVLSHSWYNRVEFMWQTVMEMLEYQ